MSDYKRLTNDKEKYRASQLGYTEMYDRLAELEDKIENGELIELPFIIRLSKKYACIVKRGSDGNLMKTVSMPISEAQEKLSQLKEKRK